MVALDLKGERVQYFVNYCFSSNVEELKDGLAQPTSLVTRCGNKGPLPVWTRTFTDLLSSQMTSGLAATFLRPV